jgi:hypothetical protein
MSKVGLGRRCCPRLFASYGYPAVGTVEAINNVTVPTGPK